MRRCGRRGRRSKPGTSARCSRSTAAMSPGPRAHLGLSRGVLRDKLERYGLPVGVHTTGAGRFAVQHAASWWPVHPPAGLRRRSTGRRTI